MNLLVIGKEERFTRYTADAALLARHHITYIPCGSAQEELIAKGADAQVIIADAVAQITGDAIRSLPRLRLIHSEGVAYNGIDIEAAREQGVYVCNCKGMNALAVAEQTILLMLGLLRGVRSGDADVREGRQIQTKERYMREGSLKELGDCTIGLIGFGDIARETARLARAFGSEVVYHNRTGARPDLDARYGVSYKPLDELLSMSDIVSLHAPVTPETTHMADRTFFAQMKKGAYLVNTSRGELVESAALLEAIRGGWLAGAGIDTLEQEPVQRDNPLLQGEPEVEERLLYSPHIGGITATSFRRGYQIIWANIARIEAGERPDCVVNA